MTHTDTLLPPLDAWTASSLLQKAIRRGDIEYAQAAALTFFRLRGRMIWRRLMLIVHEDVGVGDINLCIDVTKCAVDLNARRLVGSDQDCVLALVMRLCKAPKNREGDYLICTAKQASSTEALRASVASKAIADQISMAADQHVPLLGRAVATWMASGVNGGGPQTLSAGDLRGLLKAFDRLGLPPCLSSTLDIACAMTREPIVMMVPLLWAALQAANETADTIEHTLPPSILCGGVPSYTFDKHTRVGKQAVQRLVAENREVADSIAYFVPEFRASDVALMAAFYADAVSVKQRANWSRSRELYDLGLHTDMTKVGTPDEGVATIAAVILKNLDHLNHIRRSFREKSRKRFPRHVKNLGNAHE